MPIDLNINARTISQWKWMAYPAAVGIFLIILINWGLNSGSRMWTQILETREKSEVLAGEVEVLRTKIGVLEKVRLGDLAESLSVALQAVPPTSRPWLLINQLRQAGAEAEVGLVSYKGTGGDTKEATAAAETVRAPGSGLMLEANYLVDSWEKVERLLASLENKIPLIKVVRADYDETGNVNLMVEGSVVEWKKVVTQDLVTPLPDYAQKVEYMRQRLSDFRLVSLPLGVEEGQYQEENPNPF